MGRKQRLCPLQCSALETEHNGKCVTKACPAAGFSTRTAIASAALLPRGSRCLIYHLCSRSHHRAAAARLSRQPCGLWLPRHARRPEDIAAASPSKGVNIVSRRAPNLGSASGGMGYCRLSSLQPRVHRPPLSLVLSPPSASVRCALNFGSIFDASL
jgi:hypothetical protein